MSTRFCRHHGFTVSDHGGMKVAHAVYGVDPDALRAELYQAYGNLPRS